MEAGTLGEETSARCAVDDACGPAAAFVLAAAAQLRADPEGGDPGPRCRGARGIPLPGPIGFGCEAEVAHGCQPEGAAPQPVPVSVGVQLREPCGEGEEVL